ncbi:hypothetical protein HETIRDRAFT_330208, partial [Heterobasidion irregulare TC 32-1]
VKCRQTDSSAAKHPSVGYGQLGGGQPCLVIVSIFGTCLALFGIFSKPPKYLLQTLA